MRADEDEPLELGQTITDGPLTAGEMVRIIDQRNLELAGTRAMLAERYPDGLELDAENRRIMSELLKDESAAQEESDEPPQVTEPPRSRPFPQLEDASQVLEEPPPIAADLLPGILRVGEKGLLAAESKLGKTWLACALAVACASAGEWCGVRVPRPIRVLYVNAELPRPNFYKRLAWMEGRLGLDPLSVPIGVLNTRGWAGDLHELAENIAPLIQSQGFELAIVDPIYKYLGEADENKSLDITRQLAALDTICELGCSVLYVHHHGKGQVEGRKVIDRAVGSGSFARDADLIVDASFLSFGDADLGEWCAHGESQYSRIQDAKRANIRAVRLSFVMRDQPERPPVNLWRELPLFRVDSTGTLANCGYGDGGPNTETATSRRTNNALADWKTVNGALEMAFLSFDGRGTPPTARELFDATNWKAALEGTKRTMPDPRHFAGERWLGNPLCAFTLDGTGQGATVRRRPPADSPEGAR